MLSPQKKLCEVTDELTNLIARRCTSIFSQQAGVGRPTAFFSSSTTNSWATRPVAGPLLLPTAPGPVVYGLWEVEPLPGPWEQAL